MTFNLLLRSIGRVLWFAVAGAIYTMIIGVFAGAITGGLLIALLDFLSLSNTGRDIREGTMYSSIVLLYISPVAGFFAFTIAGYFACFSKIPSQVFHRTFLSAWRAAFLGVIIGGVLGTINALIFGRFLLPDFLSADEWADGYILGVIGGFVIGTFYGAIVGAKREIARQKAETKAALPVVGSAAL